MSIKLQLRRGTASDWRDINPTLSEGEIGLETDQRKYKVGNGSSAWLALPYMREGTVVENGTTLPTGGDISSWQLFYLTAADSTAKAPPGMYVHDGTGWICLACTTAYALGNSGATPSLALIPGVMYTLTQNQIITSLAFTFTRPGTIMITKSGAYAVATPTMAGRTVKLLTSGAWASAIAALSCWTIQDDGTYCIIAASAMATPS